MSSKAEATKGEHVIVNKCSRFPIGYYDDIGKRKTMEDALCIYGDFEGNKQVDYFGIFDGHGGDRASHAAAGNLYKVFAREFASQDIHKLDPHDVKSRIKKAFLTLGDKLEDVRSGCTGLVCLIVDNVLYCANCGDSRAVLLTETKVKRISHDHKPELPEEKERIEEAGGFVAEGGGGIPRVNKILSVARGFGDAKLGDLVPADPYISATDFKEFRKDGKEKCKYEYVVMACDGIWDVLSDKDVCLLVTKYAEEGKSENEIAKKLVDMAYERDSHDNCTVIVIRLRGRKSKKRSASEAEGTDDTESKKKKVSVH